VPFVLYVAAALRTTYSSSHPASWFKAVLLSAWAIGVLTVYRFILFFTTLYAT
jgi:hypothetical protein